jgi:hypothetical protein
MVDLGLQQNIDKRQVYIHCTTEALDLVSGSMNISLFPLSRFAWKEIHQAREGSPRISLLDPDAGSKNGRSPTLTTLLP